MSLVCVRCARELVPGPETHCPGCGGAYNDAEGLWVIQAEPTTVAALRRLVDGVGDVEVKPHKGQHVILVDGSAIGWVRGDAQSDHTFDWAGGEE